MISSNNPTSSIRHIVGLISGTSADAIDAVLVKLSGSGRETEWEILHHSQHSLSPNLRQTVFELSMGRSSSLLVGGPAAQVALLDTWLAEAFADAVLACLNEAGLTPSQVDLAASHGQTVCHLPGALKCDRWELRATLQLGSGAVIAARTGLPVVCDFRTADLALGGQGAPLVPYADWVLFSEEKEVRAVQNLGGIGNVTFLPGPHLEKVVAFDTGPANMLVDAAMRHFSGGLESFDRDGQLARSGRISAPLLEFILEHPFLQKPPPKSTGHEDFGQHYFENVLVRADHLRLSPADLAATLTAVGPESAVAAYHRYLPHLPDRVILGGGGSLNPVVVEHFRRLCSPTAVNTCEDFGIPAQAKEALAFAILANETLDGRCSNVPQATGASRRAILGCLYLPPG